METDTLGRRARNKRQSSGKPLRPMARDLLWFEKLHHHGPLPTSYLHRFSEHLPRSKDAARAIKRMARLYHEGALLSKPGKQFDTMEPGTTMVFEELETPRGLPLSIRLLNQCHLRLMQGMRGANKQPGEIRASQNWIGGSRPGMATFVPPPPLKVQPLLNVLLKCGTLGEVGSNRRNKRYRYHGYLEALS